MASLVSPPGAKRFQGAKFRRQVPLGPYVVDFLCEKASLVIEIDGGQHAERIDADEARTRWLEARGYRVARYWNNEVMGNVGGVLWRYREEVVTLSPALSQGRGRPATLSPALSQGKGGPEPSPRPSPKGEGGPVTLSPTLSQGRGRTATPSPGPPPRGRETYYW